jgi:hypothetical protein
MGSDLGELSFLLWKGVTWLHFEWHVGTHARCMAFFSRVANALKACSQSK